MAFLDYEGLQTYTDASKNWTKDIVKSTTNANVVDQVFKMRKTGGKAIVSDGDAWLTTVKGKLSFSGDQGELTVRVSNVQLIVTVDKDIYYAQKGSSGATGAGSETFTYTSEGWKKNSTIVSLEENGITVVGEPSVDDTINIDKTGLRRSLSSFHFSHFVSTGWNLFKSGKIRVVAYNGEESAYRIEGAFTKLEFSTDIVFPASSTIEIVVTDGNFTISQDGYLKVTGYDYSTTCIYMACDGWENGYEGEWQPYTETVIDFSSLAAIPEVYYADGVIALYQVDQYQDTVDLNSGIVTSYVQRLSFNYDNMIIAKESGRPFVYNAYYIFLVRETPIQKTFNIDNKYTARSRGIEFFAYRSSGESDTGLGHATTLYGQNISATLEEHAANIEERRVFLVDVSSFSSMPVTVTNSKITSDMVVVWYMVSRQYAQASDWTVKTYDGYLTVEGTLALGASTSMRLVLAKYRA